MFDKNKAIMGAFFCCLFLAASVYSLYSGWWNAAGWFGVISFAAMWAALDD